MDSPQGLLHCKRLIDLGIVPQGREQHEYFELTNPTAKRIEIDRIETSCDCLNITLANPEIPPGANVLACADLDLTRAIDFRGKVRIEAKGLTTRDQIAFLINIEVDARPKTEFGNLENSFHVDPQVPPKPVPMVLREKGNNSDVNSIERTSK